jgi:hypothetical protein
VELDETHGPAHLTRRQKTRPSETPKDPQVDRRADDPYAQENAPE